MNNPCFFSTIVKFLHVVYWIFRFIIVNELQRFAIVPALQSWLTETDLILDAQLHTRYLAKRASVQRNMFVRQSGCRRLGVWHHSSDHLERLCWSPTECATRLPAKPGIFSSHCVSSKCVATSDPILLLPCIHFRMMISCASAMHAWQRDGDTTKSTKHETCNPVGVDCEQKPWLQVTKLALSRLASLVGALTFVVAAAGAH